jgi:pimeloyl-ACP methyl ester carboxylesterase
VIYEEMQEIRIPAPEEDLYLYTSGEPDAYPVILVHGWEASPGSMLGIARKLKEKGYRPYILGLPAHGKSKLKTTNMIHAAGKIKCLLEYLDLNQPFTIIGHSFASGAITLALLDYKKHPEKLVFLTTPDKIMDIFTNYAQMIALGEKALNKMIRMVEGFSPIKMKDFNISDLLQEVSTKKILLIHDKEDKILPFTNALSLKEKNPSIHLHATKQKGHYRLLWDEEVIDMVMQFIFYEASSTSG